MTMTVQFFSARRYDQESMEAVNSGKHEFRFAETRLDPHTARIAHGCLGVCGFVNDAFSADVLEKLATGGTRLVLLRNTGFNNVDLPAAEANGLVVLRVSQYSPYSVAEHVIALLQTLNRKTHKAYNRAREDNFLLEGLLGSDLHGKTVGIAGTGKIGTILAHIMHGFGCKLLGYDLFENDACKAIGLSYVPFEVLLRQSDVVSLHMPLTPESHYIINKATLGLMKPGAFLINTSRGALIDTAALVAVLKSGKLAGVGLDVYEEEERLFFQDRSGQIIQDDVFSRLLTFPNVLVTGHQGFFTREALHDIATATLQNIADFEAGMLDTPNRLTAPAMTR
jgi:D-lactate dehydrogenase